jgi:hypothetical protein
MRLQHRRIRLAAEPIALLFDCKQITGYEGETFAAALSAANRILLRRTRTGAPRGPYCKMGACFGRIVEANGCQSQRAYLTKADAGADVGTQLSAAPPARPDRIPQPTRSSLVWLQQDQTPLRAIHGDIEHGPPSFTPRGAASRFLRYDPADADVVSRASR